jgi:hypothetical protein
MADWHQRQEQFCVSKYLLRFFPELFVLFYCQDKDQRAITRLDGLSVILAQVFRGVSRPWQANYRESTLNYVTSACFQIRCLLTIESLSLHSPGDTKKNYKKRESGFR